MTTTTVDLLHRGAELQGQIALPAGPGRHPGVLVMYNARGLSPHMVKVATCLAERGYVALATDMYGGGGYYPDKERAGKALAPLWADPELLRSRVVSWYDHIKSRPDVDPNRIVAVGYCFGGQCVLELARSGADVKAVVSFHGILKTAAPALKGVVKALVSVYTGALDPYAPHADVQAFRAEMIAAEASWQLTEFGRVYHSFTDYHQPLDVTSGMGYDPLAENLSWAGMLAAFEAALSPSGAKSSLYDL